MEPKKKHITDYILPLLFLLIVLFLSLHMAMSFERVKDNLVIKDFLDSNGNLIENRKFNVTAFLYDLKQNIFSYHFYKVIWVKSSINFIAGAAAVYGFVCLYLYSSKKKYIFNKEYGTSRWAITKEIKHLLAKNVKKEVIKGIKKKHIKPIKKYKEIEEARKKYDDSSNIIFTQTEKICTYNFELNANTLIIGGSGSGKTRGYVLPNLLQCSPGDKKSGLSPSVIVTDPKGEILEKIGFYLDSVCNYKIKVLNLKELNRSFGYNPFQYIMEEKYEEQIPTLVMNIMKSKQENNSNGSKDPFWEEMACILLNSLFFAVYEGFPKEERNMSTVMEIFRWFEVSDDDDRLKNPTKLDSFFTVFSEDEEILNKYGNVNTNPALRSWEDFRTKCKGKTAQGVTATALSKLAPFDETEIRRIFMADELNLDKVGEERTALFVILPPTIKRYNFIANMLYTQLFEQLEYCATVKHNQFLPVPVRFILDEFYNTGKLPNFENILSYARSFGIGITIILQSLDQIKEMYEKSWGTIVDNCDTFLYLGKIRHIETLKYISDLLGKGTYDKRTSSITKGRQSSSNLGYDKLGRELLDPSEVQRLNKKKCLLFINGYHPFISKKYQYTIHKKYKYTSDFNKNHSYQYQTPERIVEQMKSPHGEEISVSYQNTPPILLGLDCQDNLRILEDNILSSNFESGEEVALSMYELEEINIIQQLLEQEDKKKYVNDSYIMNATPLIKITEDDKSVTEFIESVINQEEPVDIVSPAYMEDFVKMKDLEEWEDDSLDSLKVAIENLVSDMADDSFISTLSSVDLEKVDLVKEQTIKI